MLTGKELGVAIRDAIQKKGVTQRALALAFDVKPPSIQDWMNKGTIGKDKLPALWEYFQDVVGPEHWGLARYPQWQMQRQSSGDFPDAAPVAQFLPGFEELSIPVLAQTGSMGPGSESLPSDVVRGRLTVSPQWAQQHVKPTDLKNLRFIHGYGDSMDPTFVDGDILLVDVGVKDPKVDGVYVMEANDRIYIKRVRQRMDGSFEISSDNANVKTVDVLNGDHQVEIHGRVVWCWNGKKM